MSLLEELYFGDYKGCELPAEERKEIEADGRRIEARREKLTSSLDEEQCKELNIIFNALAETASKEKFYLYKNGFIAGVSLASER